jgi:hypothetical protein
LARQTLGDPVYEHLGHQADRQVGQASFGGDQADPVQPRAGRDYQLEGRRVDSLPKMPTAAAVRT